MPRLRGLKARQVIRAFERAGGVVSSGKGDHVKISMPNGSLLVLRAADEVGIGLLRDLLKRAELTEEDFEKHLR